MESIAPLTPKKLVLKPLCNDVCIICQLPVCKGKPGATGRRMANKSADLLSKLDKCYVDILHERDDLYLCAVCFNHLNRIKRAEERLKAANEDFNAEMRLPKLQHSRELSHLLKEAERTHH